MPGIFASLTSASYSLQAQSLAVQQAGKNIANINNPDYSRQRVIMGSMGMHETGVQSTSGSLIAIGVEQVRDVFIDRQILGEISYLSSLETLDFRLRQALANLGDTIDRSSDSQFIDDISQQGGGLRGSVDSLFNAFEALTSRPNDPTTRQVLFQSAQGMVDSFHRIDQRFDLLERELNAQLNQETGNFNRLLGELEEINLEIARLEIGDPRSALDLRDLRQAKLEELSRYGLLEVNEPPGANGQIELTTMAVDGSPLVLLGPGSPAKELQFDANLQSFKIRGTGQDVDLQAGLLPAVLEAQTNQIAGLRTDLDSMANALASGINDLYYQAFVPAGPDPAVPEISFFQQPTPPPSAGGTELVTARSIALYKEPSDPSVTDFVPLSAETLRATATGISGANELALAIADLATVNQPALGGISFSEHASRMVTGLAQDIRNVQNRMEVQKDVKTLLEVRRGEVSGVSMDEEVSNMIQYQRAYQATSRFFNVLSEMLDTLINGLGR